jgi:hypothetical protein
MRIQAHDRRIRDMSCTGAAHVPIVLIMALRWPVTAASGAPFPAPGAARSHPSGSAERAKRPCFSPVA